MSFVTQLPSWYQAPGYCQVRARMCFLPGPVVPLCMCRVSPIPDYCSQAQRRNPIRVPLNATTVTWGYLCEFVRAVPMFMLLVDQWTDVYGWVPNGQGYTYPGVVDVALYQNYFTHKSVSLTDLDQKCVGPHASPLGTGVT